jgi:tape measure domain-containing protein
MSRNKIEFAVVVKDDASHQLQRISKETDALTTSFKRLAASAISIGTGFEVLKLADTYRLLQNRLRLVTEGTEELKTVTDELVETALKTRTSFQSTADLYARLARSSRELGLSQKEIIDFTETISKSIRISGSTSQEAAAGVIQFGQALASSRLSGDEFRSVVEQMPRLAQAIAEGMGVGIGRLREMGQAGELTTDQVLGALRKAAPEIAAEFEKMVPILSEAMTNLNTSIQVSVGRFDEMLGLTTMLASAVMTAADEIELLSSILFGTAEEGEKLSDVMQAIAIGAIVAAKSIQIFGRSLFDTTKFIGTSGYDILKTFAGQLLSFDLDDSADQGRLLAARLGKGFTETFTDLESDIRTDAVDAFTSIMKILGEIASDFEAVDLTQGGEAGEVLSKNQLDAIAKATEQLTKMREALLLETHALLEAEDTGGDFAKILDRMKIEAAGLASGLPELANEVNSLQNSLDVNKEIAEAGEQLAKMKAELTLQNHALIKSAASGEEYATVLQRMKVAALGVADANAEAMVEVIALQREVDKRQATAEDDAVVDALKEELGLLKQTAEWQFINAELAKLSAEASKEQRDAIIAAASEIFALQEAADEAINFNQKLAERAAQNIQDAFAEFLFDPFEDGIRGMVINFIDALRKMIAQALAFQILTNIPGIGGFFKTGIGTRAEGGPVPGGMPVLVGERGPELFVPHASGNIRNNSAINGMSSPVTFISNVDARGADPGLIARLPGILEQRDKRIMLNVKKFFETGSITI